MVFAVESIAACVLFTVLLEIATLNRREIFVNDYPPVVTDKLRLAPFDKFYKRAGISAFEKSAVWFHCKASIRGMAIGIIFAPIVGFIVMLL